MLPAGFVVRGSESHTSMLHLVVFLNYAHAEGSKYCYV